MSVPGAVRGRRQYVRAFDHDEAQRRYDAGESLTDLAAEYGVTRNAVYQVVTVVGRQSVRRSALSFQMRHENQGVCDDCGGSMSLASRTHGSTRCSGCANLAQATTVRDGELRCFRCGEWKPDEGFYNGGNRLARRGRKSECRACDNAARRDYRERNRERERAYWRARSALRRRASQQAAPKQDGEESEADEGPGASA